MLKNVIIFSLRSKFKVWKNWKRQPFRQTENVFPLVWVRHSKRCNNILRAAIFNGRNSNLFVFLLLISPTITPFICICAWKNLLNIRWWLRECCNIMWTQTHTQMQPNHKSKPAIIKHYSVVCCSLFLFILFYFRTTNLFALIKILSVEGMTVTVTTESHNIFHIHIDCDESD